MYPEGAGRRVLVLSNSGGPGVLTTDAATNGGLQIASLPDSFAAPLRSALPAEAAVANPMDLLADAREDRFAMCFEAALAHAPSAFDQILMLHVVPFMVDAEPVVAQLAALKAGRAVPVMHAMMGTLGDRDGWFGTLEAAGIPAFGDGEDMACAAACLARLADLKAHRVEA